MKTSKLSSAWSGRGTHTQENQVVTHMNQPAMEQALGKLVIDGQFRDAFFQDPATASAAAGIPLTDEEVSALTRIRPGALGAFERYLVTKRLSSHERGAA